ncbi:MAG: DNA adenine methylase [Caldilineaceae bacterium]|nr:DNA adenine methylase [Caldilineaceae bacterium]
MRPRQPTLFSPESVRNFNFPFPSTRYQGSKRVLADWIWENVCDMKFDTVLDVFGGTGVVSYMFKNASKQVTYNDHLRFNWFIGRALIENHDVQLTDSDMELILQSHEVIYPDIIKTTFGSIYYTDEENAWLDRAIFNINHFLADPYKQALAFFSLCQ